jgi:hypothetical protein
MSNTMDTTSKDLDSQSNFLGILPIGSNPDDGMA